MYQDGFNGPTCSHSRGYNPLISGIGSRLYNTVAVSPTRSVFPDFGPDPDFFPKKVWKKSVFYPKSLFFYKIATYYTFLESLGPGQCNKNIFKMF